MYVFYLKNCLETINALNTANQTKLKPRDIGMIFPFYLNADLQENKLLYPIYFLQSYSRQISRRLKKLIFRQKSLTPNQKTKK